MQISFPIYLTRLFSSVLCGLCILALFCAEYGTYVFFTAHSGKCVFSHLCSVADCGFVMTSVLFAGIFFLGELFSGIAEACVFDPMFNNVRSVKQSNKTHSKLENVTPRKTCKFRYLLPFPCNFTGNKSKQKIRFKHFLEFSKSEGEVAFSLSEMYFNLHRVLGGIYIFFWFAMVVSVLLFFAKTFECLSCISDIKSSFCMLFCLAAVNILLALFTANQSCKYRMFANHLICFSTSSSKKIGRK